MFSPDLIPLLFTRTTGVTFDSAANFLPKILKSVGVGQVENGDDVVSWSAIGVYALAGLLVGLLGSGINTYIDHNNKKYIIPITIVLSGLGAAIGLLEQTGGIEVQTYPQTLD